MTATCPWCGSWGQAETVGPAHDIGVRYCGECNLVFDGLAPSGYQPPRSSRGDKMTSEAWADAVETGRAALERARIAERARRDAAAVKAALEREARRAVPADDERAVS